MRKLSSDESKKLLVNILSNVANFCDKYGIKYSIGYGTLIGAIRHKGFIPWDDDIDIIMLRDDYERFISLYKNDRYIIIDGDKQVNHFHVRVSDSFTKVKYIKETTASKFYKDGLWIDVFPIDKVPDTRRGYLFHRQILRALAGMRLVGEIGGKGCVRKTARVLLKPFSKFLGKLAEKRIVKYNKKNTHTVANMAAYYADLPSFPLDYLKDFIEVEFEGQTFRAINQYDAFLRGYYGDYMKLPPVEKRISHHFYDAFIIE